MKFVVCICPCMEDNFVDNFVDKQNFNSIFALTVHTTLPIGTAYHGVSFALYKVFFSFLIPLHILFDVY